MFLTEVDNRLLKVLPARSRDAIVAAGQFVELPIRTPLFEAGATPKHLYFLGEGLASIVVSMETGGSAEVGMTGCEGLVGATALLASAPTPAECFMQVTGSGLRVPLKVMRAVFEEDAEMRHRVLQFVQCQFHIAWQIVACNKLHEAEARLARWLLMSADRSRMEQMNLTQEFLAEMLGTRRTTVALVAGALQRRGLIDYSRGRVRILDRAGLTAAACECYQVTTAMMETLYTP